MGHKHTINSTLQLSMVVINGDVLRFNKILNTSIVKASPEESCNVLSFSFTFCSSSLLVFFSFSLLKLT